jgi:hypothetical protein
MEVFKLNDKESKRVTNFYYKHYDKGCKGTYWVVTFTATGIGHKVVIKCPVCGKEKDISDYTSW